jgi:uncharacterized protein (TIGR03437 family)
VLIRIRLFMCCFLGFASFLAAANSPVTSYIIQTVAGSDFAADGPSALAAIFSQTEGIAIDGGGTIYVADADDNRVRKINSDGSIQTVAGTGVAGFAGDGGPSNAAMLSHPYGVAIDAQGNIYIADLGNKRVRKISPGGTVATVAGGGTTTPGGNGDGGPATNAQLLEPRNVAVDSYGTLYVSDFGAHRVYRITPGGILTTLAGTGNAGFSGDGGASQLAQLNSPAGLASDASGALYIADSANNRIRKVYQGVITTVYTVTGPTGIAISPAGALYIAASGYLGTQFKAIGGISPARDVTLDRTGNVYVTTGQYVDKVSSSGTVTTVAGSAAEPYFGGDNGPATAARLHAPSGLAVDDAGNWYIADTANNRIRKITPAGIITTIAGTGDAGLKGDNGSATLAQLNGPRSVACDSQHNIYIADSGNNSVRKITRGGVIQTVAVQLGVPLNDPEYVATDSQDSLYIADAGNGRVLKVTSSGLISSVMLVLHPSAVTVDGSGNIYVTAAKAVSKLTPAGALTTVLDGLNSPRGLAVTPTGDLIVADSGANVVRRLSSTGVLSTIAGTGAAGFSGDGLAASAAQLNSPADLVVDLTGTIWMADSGNNRIRMLAPSIVADVTATATLVHSATMTPGPIAPGEIVTIFGAGFDPNQTQLLFGSEAATVFYVGPGQINALAPADLTPSSITDISIVVDGTKVADVPSQVVNAAPGIFTTGNGTGQAAAVNQDGTLNSESNPAARGSIVVLYATGQGQAVASTVSLKIGLYPAELLYAGPAPGFPGLMQINAEVPAGFLPPGIQPVILSVGSASSQAGVTIAVR